MAKPQRRDNSAPQKSGARRIVILRALFAIALFALGVSGFLALASYAPPSPGQNLIGPWGHGLARLLFAGFGVLAYPFAVLACAMSFSLAIGRPRPSWRWLAWTLSAASFGALLHLAFGRSGGGAVGALVGEATRDALSTTGGALALCALISCGLVVATDMAAAKWAAIAARWALEMSRVAASIVGEALRSPEANTNVPAAALPVVVAPPALPLERKVAEKKATVEAGEDARLPTPEAAPPLPKVVMPPPPPPRSLAPKPPLEIAKPKRSDFAATSEDKISAPEIIEPKTPPKPTGPFQMKDGRTDFTLPPSSLLEVSDQPAIIAIDRPGLTATAEKLRKKLQHFGIEGQVTEIRPGPVVTMFEFLPAPGVKISRIASLSDDLAMAMEALRVRIVAPIPGKGVVGIEVPNRDRQTVYLKELVEQESFQNASSKLTMCVGKDIEGMPYICDLAKMPHLLIAGTTGSGKSVGVNAMIVSMLLRASPQDVRFIMVDPKMLELSVYEGIPHLLLPVVTDSKKAALALRWAVDEMERRYAILSADGVRSIVGYNKKNQEQDKHLPYIVIIIDELADLMMVASKEVETYIARLAQMARAAGIHLMVATQRPSTDVVTGVIKANFPARISFQVASRHDSTTIINSPGAENLLGMGDMLIIPPGTSYQTRVHGALVTETEVGRVVDAWKAQGAPIYDDSILRARPEDEAEADGDEEAPDELYDQALAAIADMRQISISLLQRKLRVGYNRSARMIERMERDGVVGPADGAKPRDVLMRSNLD